MNKDEFILMMQDNVIREFILYNIDICYIDTPENKDDGSTNLAK